MLDLLKTAIYLFHSRLENYSFNHKTIPWWVKKTISTNLYKSGFLQMPFNGLDNLKRVFFLYFQAAFSVLCQFFKESITKINLHSIYVVILCYCSCFVGSITLSHSFSWRTSWRKCRHLFKNIIFYIFFSIFGI